MKGKRERRQLAGSLLDSELESEPPLSPSCWYLRGEVRRCEVSGSIGSQQGEVKRGDAK